MDRIIIIDDEGIQRELHAFLEANRQRIRFDSDMDELAGSGKPMLEEIIRNYNESRKLIVSSGDEMTALYPHLLVYLQQSEGGVVAVHGGSEATQLNITLDEVEPVLAVLPFLRVHPDFLVNILKIAKICYTDDDPAVIMLTGERIPLSMHMKNRLLKMLERYIR